MSVGENAETSSRVAMICPRASVGNATWPQSLEFDLVSGAHWLVSGCHAAVTPERIEVARRHLRWVRGRPDVCGAPCRPLGLRVQARSRGLCKS